MVRSVSEHSSEQSIATAHGQLYRRMSPKSLYQNHQRQRTQIFTVIKCPFNLSRTQIEWPPMLTTTASFPSVFLSSAIFKETYAASKLFGSQGCHNDKNGLTFLVSSLRFLDFVVQF